MVKRSTEEILKKFLRKLVLAKNLHFLYKFHVRDKH